ncbi:uncharacterized protein KY384_002182 [Bacidia gigantensis]|uniref:uncharacterized protein n=1 Tax=Bacidia gigantensis TaxID=2732470 RepID=UPI001D0585B3|nr:uncharacterized protein KY384_002182 [Bacidia gigantensis]KAG8533399.1 hypothetical protein KY384_002182 [Bacidia gigantensis]
MQPGRILKVAIPILGLACLAVADLYPGQVAGPLSQTYQDFDDVRDLAERMTDENVKKNLADIVKTLDSMNQNLKRAADLWNGSSGEGAILPTYRQH